jgi:hypothetical protein
MYNITISADLKYQLTAWWNSQDLIIDSTPLAIVSRSKYVSLLDLYWLAVQLAMLGHTAAIKRVTCHIIVANGWSEYV